VREPLLFLWYLRSILMEIDSPHFGKNRWIRERQIIHDSVSLWRGENYIPLAHGYPGGPRARSTYWELHFAEPDPDDLRPWLSREVDQNEEVAEQILEKLKMLASAKGRYNEQSIEFNSQMLTGRALQFKFLVRQ
jgi:LPS O-antigen subunit length determinant protein (WzzB/FepE family)